MSLIVETGAVVANANGYITEADADAYHESRGNAVWSSVSDKEAAIVKATDYMTQQYRSRWKGYRKDATQVLDWPRTFVYLEPFVHGATGTYPFLVADNIVPLEVQQACAELALRAATASLAPDLSRGKQSVTIGPLNVVYDRADPQQTRYRAVDALLKPYLTGSTANVPLVPTV